MTLVWDGVHLAINSGFWEWGGSGDGSPALSARVAEQASFGSIVPPNGCPVLQRVITAPGDVYQGSTGWRTLSRQHNPIQTRPIGFDSNMVMAVWTPAGYPGDAGMYVCPLEYHHTSPGGTTGVVPAAITMDQNGIRVRLWGGTTNASGGVGNPGHTVTFDNQNNPYPITTRNCWHVFVVRLKYGFKDNSDPNLRGACNVYHARIGIDTAMVSITGNLTNINCGYGTLSYYPLFGLYRGQTGSSTTTIYLAGSREYTTTAEALAWANTMLGSVVTPPPVDPVQIPYVGNWTTGKFVNSQTIGSGPASSSFQGPWTNAIVVHAYNPAPSSAFEGSWTTPEFVDTFPTTGVPQLITLPAITGTLIEGQTLTSSTGSWTNNPTSYLYYWQRSVTGDPNNIFWSAIQPGSAVNTYTLTNADVGMFIRCGETATNAAGTSTPVPSNTVGPIAAVGAPPDTTAPSDPGPISQTAQPTQTTVSIGWVAATDAGGVTGYEVERAQASSGFALIATVTGTSMTDTSLSPSTTYSYRVRARDAAGNQSGYSTTFAATTAAGTPAGAAPTSTAPPTVTGSLVVGDTLSCSTGSWNNNPTSFSYAWSSAPTGTQVFTLLVSSSQSTYLLTVAEETRDIRCVVVGSNDLGFASVSSNIVGPVVAAAPPPDVTAPTAPSVLNATATSDTAITLTWGASFDARGVAGYEVERAQGTGTFAPLVTVAATNTVNAGLTPGTTYSYRVRAFDAAGNLSAYSNTDTVVTTDVPPPPVADTDRTLILTPV